jgi:hypothetical protein
MKNRICLSLIGLGAVCLSLPAASDSRVTYTTRTLALSDHRKGNITMDYIAGLHT